MESVLGIAALFAGLAGTVALVCRRPPLTNVLFFAFAVRALAALFHAYVAPLPDGSADAVKFEQVAWRIASSARTAIEQALLSPSFFYSRMAAVLYSATGRSALMLQAGSVLAGVLVVYLAWRLARELWDEASAKLTAWLVAGFPALIMYSALTMREVFFSALLLLGLWLVVCWANTGRLLPAVGALLAFGIGILFHPAMLAAAAAFAAIWMWVEWRRDLFALLEGRLRYWSLVPISLTIAALGYALATNLNIPKFGTVDQLFDMGQYAQLLGNRVYGDAAYPMWMVPSDPVDMWWILPLRVVYLVVSPLPWDIKFFEHLIGFVDGLAYFGFALAVLANGRAIRRNRAAAVVLIILIAVLVVFAIGTGNFGTALRHRSTLVAVIIALAAPYLARVFARRRAGSPLSGRDNTAKIMGGTEIV